MVLNGASVQLHALAALPLGKEPSAAVEYKIDWESHSWLSVDGYRPSTL